MPLDYTSLVQRIVDVIHESNVGTTQAQQFLDQCQPKVQRDLLSSIYGGSVPRQMMARITDTSTTDAKITLPGDYYDARSVSINGNVVRYASPEKVASNDAGYSEGDVVLDYYQQVPVLSASQTTNWLLAVSEDVYIYGACVQYVPWSKELSNMELFNPFYEDAVRKTKAAHGAQPRGGQTRKKGTPYGAFYTVIGEEMLFGSAS